MFAISTRHNFILQTTTKVLTNIQFFFTKTNCICMYCVMILLQLLCRTAIALEQEKVIEKYTKEMEDLKTEIRSTNQNTEKLKEELKVLMEKYQANEQMLKDREDTIKNNNMGNLIFD